MHKFKNDEVVEIRQGPLKGSFGKVEMCFSSMVKGPMYLLLIDGNEEWVTEDVLLEEEIQNV